MSPAVTLMTLTIACAGAVRTEAAPQVLRLTLELPTGIETDQTHLLLRDVTVPRNRGVILRAYAIGRDSIATYLGSAAIPAFARAAAGEFTAKELRINVTSGLRRWRAENRDARAVTVEIRQATGDSSTVQTDWRVGSAALVPSGN